MTERDRDVSGGMGGIGERKEVLKDLLDMANGCLETFKGIFECVVDDVGVNLSSGEILMTEGTLDEQNIPSSAVEVSRESVPKRVRAELLNDTCCLEPISNTSCDLPLAKTETAIGNEESITLTVPKAFPFDYVTSQKRS